jgi:hypothetical protein
MRTIIARSGLRATTLALALLAIGACGKKTDESSTQTSGGTIGPASNTVQVADVGVGRGVSADKRIANQTDTFAARDTIYASIHTTGAAPNTNLTARWTFQDGQVVDERTETISPTGDAYTEFHISKPSGWPGGRYTLHVLVNGQETQTKDITVNR